mgnify:FL=1
MSKPRANAEDDPVYSNIAYMIPAALAPTFLAAQVLMFTSAALVAGSSVFHATYSRGGQRLDAATMLTYIASLAAAVGAVWTPWAWAVVPLAALGYWGFTWDVDSHIHVPLWALAIIVMLFIQEGFWALLPLGIFSLAGLAKYLDENPDTPMHSLWHILGGMAAGAAMWLIW